MMLIVGKDLKRMVRRRKETKWSSGWLVDSGELEKERMEKEEMERGVN